MSRPDHVERLRAIPLFAELDDDALERVAAVATEVEFPPHAVLIERNQAASGLFVILDGSVVVDLPQRNLELAAPETVGELSLLTEETDRSARVCATTPVRCLAISRSDFAQLLEDEPRIAVPLLYALAGRLRDMIVSERR